MNCACGVAALFTMFIGAAWLACVCPGRPSAGCKSCVDIRGSSPQAYNRPCISRNVHMRVALLVYDVAVRWTTLIYVLYLLVACVVCV